MVGISCLGTSLWHIIVFSLPYNWQSMKQEVSLIKRSLMEQSWSLLAAFQQLSWNHTSSPCESEGVWLRSRRTLSKKCDSIFLIALSRSATKRRSSVSRRVSDQSRMTVLEYGVCSASKRAWPHHLYFMTAFSNEVRFHHDFLTDTLTIM